MAIEKLNVDGMSCMHCVNAIKSEVEGLEGVSKVDIDLDAKTVTVEFEPNKLGLKDIIKTIEEEGYVVV